MKRLTRYIVWCGILWMLLSALPAQAQYVLHSGQREGPLPAAIDPETGDTMAIILLRNVYCFNCKHFKSERKEQQYWRMVNDVKKTLPIAKEARKLLIAAYDTMQVMDKKTQRKYFKALEKNLLKQYKPQLKKLNYRQGKLLVRLIDRECDNTSYRIIREYMGRTKAWFWQGFGMLFGISLKGKWEPDGKDKELEDVCIQVEQGLI